MGENMGKTWENMEKHEKHGDATHVFFFILCASWKTFLKLN